MVSMRPALAVVVLLLIAVASPAQLSGAYTVGGAGASYPDLAAALADLQAIGVSAPVQFTVQTSQTGPWTIGAFAGQGPANPVFITGGGTAVLSSATLPALTLSGCSDVTIDGFSATFALGTAISVAGTTASCTFQYCFFSMPTATSGSATVFSITGGTNCAIRDSDFGGGWEAFNVSAGDGLVIERCRVQGGGWWICEVAGTNTTFRNNFVWGVSNYGFRGSAGSTNLRVHNNSFYIAHPTGGSQYCSLRWYSSTYSEVYNNAFHEIHVPTNGYIMWCSGLLRPTVMNNNVYHIVNGINLMYWNGAAHSLASWQASGMDSASVQADPLFTNLLSTPPDLHLQYGSPCTDAGLTIATVVDDIDGMPRIGAYDIGADETVPRNVLTVTTGGAGAGDLFLSLTAIDAGVTEGYLLLSAQTMAAAGTGPFFGMWPDALTWTGVLSPLATGNPLHFPVGPAGVFPDVPIVAPPGTLSSLAGQTWDTRVILFTAPSVYSAMSNLVRVAW